MAKFNRTYRNDPRQIEARFNSVCGETGKKIKKGDPCIYFPKMKKVYCLESDAAKDFWKWKEECSLAENYFS